MAVLVCLGAWGSVIPRGGIGAYEESAGRRGKRRLADPRRLPGGAVGVAFRIPANDKE